MRLGKDEPGGSEPSGWGWEYRGRDAKDFAGHIRITIVVVHLDCTRACEPAGLVPGLVVMLTGKAFRDLSGEKEINHAWCCVCRSGLIAGIARSNSDRRVVRFLVGLAEPAPTVIGELYGSL
jgi:hypothetical protein